MAVLTLKHKINLVNDFINDVVSGQNNYYCFIGKATPWTNPDGTVNENNVELANTSISQIEQETYKNLIYGKLLGNRDVMSMVPRYNWTSNTIYAQYDNNDSNLFSKNFFVITDNNSVFKCIYNGTNLNNPVGVRSTVKPNINQVAGTFQTSDTYIWKYMFTIDTNTYQQFQTASYIPVIANTEVSANAIPGTIDVLSLTSVGNNYQIYETGNLAAVVNNYVVTLPSTSAYIDNYYAGSTIYLKSGLGGGQLRNIMSYSGLSKNLSVVPPFNYFENFELTNLYGTFNNGDLVTQNISSITIYYNTGYFNSNNTLVQSDTGATGLLRHANSTVFSVENINNIPFTLNYPLYNSAYSPIQQSGVVNITANSNIITSNTGTLFANNYMANNFICVGANTSTNIRRILSVNTSVITVDYPFNQTLFGTNNFLVPSAASVDSITNHNTEGSIVYTNINAAELLYSNTTPSNQTFTLGESVVLVDSSNTSQNANGTISFSNTNTLILSNVLGTMSSNLYIYGLSSQTKAYINSITSYPNITVETAAGGFKAGYGIKISTANNVPVANAFIYSIYSSPDDLTEYIISPTVSISGDGQGALAYAYVDTSSNNPNRQISNLILINNGSNYTYANVSISSNNLYGSSATAIAKLSPVEGHGYDSRYELGATYSGISKKFDTGISESYNLPLYGSYRTLGIIKSPSIKNVIFNVNNFDRSYLNITSSTGAFQTNEILIQPSSNAAGIITFSNNSYIELKNSKGTFSNNNLVYGLSSNTNANCTSSSIKYFNLSSNVANLGDMNYGSSAQINQIISNNTIRLTNVSGNFMANDVISEAASNTYATIASIYTANGLINSTANFGKYFNQTARITLTTNTKPFTLYEQVTQDISFATGRVISTVNEIDIIYSTNTNFVVGDILTNTNTGANGIVTYVNTAINYIKLSAISSNNFNETTNRPFNIGNHITNVGNTKTTSINNIYGVIVLDNVNNISGPNTTPFMGNFTVDNYNITGNTSGAVGIATLPYSIKLPDLVRESGEVIYKENINMFNKTPSSIEYVKLVISF